MVEDSDLIAAAQVAHAARRLAPILAPARVRAAAGRDPTKRELGREVAGVETASLVGGDADVMRAAAFQVDLADHETAFLIDAQVVSAADAVGGTLIVADGERLAGRRRGEGYANNGGEGNESAEGDHCSGRECC